MVTFGYLAFWRPFWALWKTYFRKKKSMARSPSSHLEAAPAEIPKQRKRCFLCADALAQDFCISSESDLILVWNSRDNQNKVILVRTRVLWLVIQILSLANVGSSLMLREYSGRLKEISIVLGIIMMQFVASHPPGAPSPLRLDLATGLGLPSGK